MKRPSQATTLQGSVQLLCAVMLWLGSAHGTEGPYLLTPIDVGYGLSVLVQDPSGTALLMDGGYREEAHLVREALAEAGVDSLALMIASHGHDDHLEGLTALLQEGFPVGSVIGNVPRGHARFDSSFWAALTDVPYARMRAGDVLSVGAMTLRVLHPDTLTDNPNESSMVISLTLGPRRVMLSADIGVGVQERLASAEGERLRSDVLVAPHHGDVIGEGFWRMVDPSWVVLSVGFNPWELPDSTMLRLAEGRDEVDTRRDGTVVLALDEEGVSVESRRPRDHSERREAEMNARLERWRHGK